MNYKAGLATNAAVHADGVSAHCERGRGKQANNAYTHARHKDYSMRSTSEQGKGTRQRGDASRHVSPRGRVRTRQLAISLGPIGRSRETTSTTDTAKWRPGGYKLVSELTSSYRKHASPHATPPCSYWPCQFPEALASRGLSSRYSTTGCPPSTPGDATSSSSSAHM